MRGTPRPSSTAPAPTPTRALHLYDRRAPENQLEHRREDRRVNRSVVEQEQSEEYLYAWTAWVAIGMVVHAEGGKIRQTYPLIGGRTGLARIFFRTCSRYLAASPRVFRELTCARMWSLCVGSKAKSCRKAA